MHPSIHRPSFSNNQLSNTASHRWCWSRSQLLLTNCLLKVAHRDRWWLLFVGPLMSPMRGAHCLPSVRSGLTRWHVGSLGLLLSFFARRFLILSSSASCTPCWQSPRQEKRSAAAASREVGLTAHFFQGAFSSSLSLFFRLSGSLESVRVPHAVSPSYFEDALEVFDVECLKHLQMTGITAIEKGGNAYCPLHCNFSV